MLAVTALACLAIGLFMGYGLASRIPRDPPQSDSNDEQYDAEPRRHNDVVDLRGTLKSQHSKIREDPALSEMKIVLIGLLETLNAAIAHLQEGSSKYEAELDDHRNTLRETLGVSDLKNLGALLIDQVEIMYTSNADYRKQVEAANVVVQKQQKEIEELQLKTSTDFLTGVPNRSAYDDRVKEMVNISRRYGNVFSLLVIDIDHFKAVNDTHGHTAGDVILRNVARTLAAETRIGDFLARYGGEEFVYLLPETDAEQAAQMCEKLLERVEETQYTHNEIEIPVTISVGIAVVIQKQDTADELFARADKALYKAKENGRNRVAIYSSEES